MGATTYTWIGDHMRSAGEKWAYDIPCWVFTHREHAPLVTTSGSWPVRCASTTPRSPSQQGTVTSGWSAEATWPVSSPTSDLLDQVVLAIAPVTLGAGRPLFPRRHDLKLVELGRNGDFLLATYDVVGPRVSTTGEGPQNSSSRRG